MILCVQTSKQFRVDVTFTVKELLVVSAISFVVAYNAPQGWRIVTFIVLLLLATICNLLMNIDDNLKELLKRKAIKEKTVEPTVPKEDLA